MTLYLNCQPDKTLISWTKKDYLLASAKRLGIDVLDIKDHAGPHDYILNIQPCEILKGVKWTGLWHIDVSLDSDFPDYYKDVDTVFVSSSVGVRPYKKEIVMFQACDPTLYTPKEQTNDFVFCGSLSPATIYEERGRVYALLEKKYDCVTVGKGLTPKIYTDTIATSRVQIVQPGYTKKSKYGMCAQRFFECLAIGPVLCAYTPDLELLGLVEGRDYFSYKNDKELFKKADRLLKSKNLRDRMARNGRQMALHLHSYDHRLVSILNIINDIKKNDRK